MRIHEPPLDSNGETIRIGDWLVSKPSYLDGSYRFKPEDVYEVSLFEDKAYKPFGAERDSEDLEYLLYVKGYVRVEDDSFDLDSVLKARAIRAERRKQEQIDKHNAKREAFLAEQELKRQKAIPFWKKILTFLK